MIRCPTAQKPRLYRSPKPSCPRYWSLAVPRHCPACQASLWFPRRFWNLLGLVFDFPEQDAHEAPTEGQTLCFILCQYSSRSVPSASELLLSRLKMHFSPCTNKCNDYYCAGTTQSAVGKGEHRSSTLIHKNADDVQQWLAIHRDVVGRRPAST